MTAQGNSGLPARFIRVIAKIEAHELKATLVSFTLVLLLMASYYILRPVRDAMASDWSDADVSILWTINFFFSFVVVTLYGAAISRMSLKNLVPAVYGFFAGTFILFYLASLFITDANLVDKAFYIWVSVFSLFPISVFWSFMADLYSKEQSKRLFGVITTGASVGAMMGPSIPLLFADLGTYNLMLVASFVLAATVPIIFYLQRLKSMDLHNENQQGEVQQMPSLGGNPLEGFKLLLQTQRLWTESP